MTEMPETMKMKQERLKKTLLDAIFTDIEKNPQRALHWAEKFSKKLLPSETTLKNAEDESFKIKYESNEDIDRRIKEINERISVITRNET